MGKHTHTHTTHNTHTHRHLLHEAEATCLTKKEGKSKQTSSLEICQGTTWPFLWHIPGIFLLWILPPPDFRIQSQKPWLEGLISEITLGIQVTYFLWFLFCMSEDLSCMMETKKTTLKVVLIYSLCQDHKDSRKEIHVWCTEKYSPEACSTRLWVLNRSFLVLFSFFL